MAMTALKQDTDPGEDRSPSVQFISDEQALAYENVTVQRRLMANLLITTCQDLAREVSREDIRADRVEYERLEDELKVLVAKGEEKTEACRTLRTKRNAAKVKFERGLEIANDHLTARDWVSGERGGGVIAFEEAIEIVFGDDVKPEVIAASMLTDPKRVEKCFERYRNELSSGTRVSYGRGAANDGDDETLGAEVSLEESSEQPGMRM